MHKKGIHWKQTVKREDERMCRMIARPRALHTKQPQAGSRQHR